jgi:16S rRNA (cytidine1402-2'-O)-methyltransferase
MTARAIDILQSVDAIYCEDTRTSAHLMQHFGIQKPLLAFHAHNEHARVVELIGRLHSGQNIALISDAGTPAISDPGFLAARAAHRSGFPVVGIPGASALVTALSASGLPCDRFIFEGFLPQKKGRKTRLAFIAQEERTVVFYESPFRILRLLEELSELVGPHRYVAVCRELTKKFEEILRGPLSEVHQTMKSKSNIKGEFVVIVAGASYTEEEA